MERDVKLDILKNELRELIKEAEFKSEILPEKYFVEYFKEKFLINIIKYLQKL